MEVLLYNIYKRIKVLKHEIPLRINCIWPRIGVSEKQSQIERNVNLWKRIDFCFVLGKILGMRIMKWSP